MMMHAPIRERSGGYNLKRIFVFRTVVIVLELLVIALATTLLGVDLPLVPVAALMAVYALFNFYTWMRTRKPDVASANEFFLHLVIDVVALTLLFYFTGGSSNPFVSLFLLPLILVATALPRRYVWIMAAVTLACYSILMLIDVPAEQPMSGHAHHMHGDAAQGSDFGLHVLGMWFSYLLAVALILFFVVTLAEALREREKRLAEAREKHLRDEHMVALGSMAAGAAHELGTPLSTMAVLTHEMAEEFADQPELKERLDILRSQVDRCKATIRQISDSAGEMKAESGRCEQLDHYLQSMLARWQTLHPVCRIEVDFEGSQPAPAVVVDETLNQALINLLNNAAEASPERIVLTAQWQPAQLELSVRDFGLGFSEQALESLGKPFFTTKEEGHGLGFYLASEVLRRLGGEVKVKNHADGGALVTVTLPLHKLLAE